MDHLRHPDLVEISRELRLRFEAVLDAEQEAAATRLERTKTLRDRLIEAHDREESVVVTTVGSAMFSGTVEAVGVDHIIVDSVCLSLFHIVAVDLR